MYFAGVRRFCLEILKNAPICQGRVPELLLLDTTVPIKKRDNVTAKVLSI